MSIYFQREDTCNCDAKILLFMNTRKGDLGAMGGTTCFFGILFTRFVEFLFLLSGCCVVFVTVDL